MVIDKKTKSIINKFTNVKTPKKTTVGKFGGDNIFMTDYSGVDNSLPTTTKGDILVDDGNNLIRLGVGSDDEVLTADSGEDSGIKWAAGGGGGSSPWTTDSNVVNLNTDTDSVTIGSATAGGKLFIDGDADEIQLQVQGHSTQTNNLVVFEDSAGNDITTFRTALSGTSSTSNFMNITGTLPANPSSSAVGSFINITTGSGTTTEGLVGFRVDLNAGSTGAGKYVGLEFINRAAGTGTTLNVGSTSTPTLNSGIRGFAQATTTGYNVGAYTEALGGDLNLGLYGKSVNAKNSATNIGVLGNGLNTGTSPIQIGGYFSLDNSTPSFESSALICDNDSQTSPIFVARDGGTKVFIIKDGGNVGIGTSVPNTTLDIDGGISLPIVTKTANYTATINDHTIICGSDGGGFTITLPSASSAYNSTDGNGLILNIKNNGSMLNDITLDGAGAETIDGLSTQTINDGTCLTIQSNGTTWYIIGNYSTGML
jgi:hypothetical protein|tara:strand:- start:486 stop:1934 length:1449 start_codon:yes stop_codon:yes gene_type:complete